ncbi:ribosome small subunit-dependent GTPase A [Aquimarina sp. MMG016]|uniref:ribosome small subunit-dependent GTPase A n=1 Tax=Aquimarina sp. MMG016 TaxID=2822690 RepID=UPI001B3A0F6D|nr:ribosome small subunit-dependent GTPase A [Aquimarina sp. MMG016]MBQ4820203.1 ribosome small subunit-dependent GTPase A [Aquimarina sp. MMG016]
MTIQDLGYNDYFEKLRIDNNLEDFEIGRVIAEHKGRYIVKNEKGEFEAEITGNLRFSAKSRKDFPAVGDWVSLINYESDFVVIHSILPRLSTLSRQAVNKFGELQIIASNIDYGLVLQSVNRDFNINRLERYLTLCYTSKIEPIIVITKTDLMDEQNLNNLLNKIKIRVKNIQLVHVSNETKQGIDVLKKLLYKGKTYCLLGSSGVGKSSLINSLIGENRMKTATISKSIDRGKHVTTHRELISMVHGAILIDNPGMREVRITDSSDGLESTFEKIYDLTQNCRFSDCTHISESDCAVQLAIENGQIEKSYFENYLKMEREKEHFESTVVEKRKKDKDFGKMIKHYKKTRKSNKY